jgi:hypothetical protein
MNDLLAINIDLARAARMLRGSGVEVVGTEFSADPGWVLFRGTIDEAWSSLALCIENDLPVAGLQCQNSTACRGRPIVPCWQLLIRARTFDTVDQLLNAM